MKNLPFIIVALILAAALGFFVYNDGNVGTTGQEDLKAQLVTFISENLVTPGTTVAVKDMVLENGLYKLTLVLNDTQEVVSYVSKDGKKFFPQVMDLGELAAEKAAGEEAAANPEIQKSDKPAIELFVMSYCPYGTQIEKGILPVLEALGDAVDFSLKFCDYAMHEKKELDEQLRQYCIQKKEPEKLLVYLQCFLGEGDSEECLKTSGINTDALNKCVAETDAKFKITENYNNKDSWVSGSFPPFDVFKEDVEKYQVGGSPTLVINGKTVQANRDPASLLKIVCSAFNNQPEQCGADLSSEAPSPGFGFEGTGSNTSASCGTE